MHGTTIKKIKKRNNILEICSEITRSNLILCCLW